MNLDLCFSTTQAPTLRPTQSIAPTATSCDNPGTCENRLRDQIYAISVRVGSVETLDDPNSAQSKATEWIVEECGADPPIDPCDVNQIMLNEQRYALAVMYFSLGGDNWNSGSNAGQAADNAEVGAWMTGKNYCEWGPEIEAQGGDKYKQLVCDEFGNVQQLNLQSNNMSGPIPPEIGVLVYLTTYISFFNAQTGSIPTALGLIAPLQTFDVESNNLDGDLFKPEYSGPNGLKEIVNWRASLNNFAGPIPTEIGLWTKIQNLWFADNEITGTVPVEIGNLVELGAFLFYSNNIAGTLPVELGNLNALTWIDMEDNDIVGTIPEEFYSNLELEEVILKNNSISGTISDKVGDLSKLATFWASFNELSGSIPTTFGNNLNLEELELQNNKITGVIPSEFGNLEALEFLSMESNALTGEIPPEMFGPQLGALRILYMNDNKLVGPVPENYGQTPRLKDLWMSDNQLTGTLPIIAEGEFLFLGTWLDVTCPPLSLPFVFRLKPLSFFLLRPTEELLINNNDMTGEVDESLCLIRNNTVPGGQLGVFHADCQPPASGGAPQILCTCCTACFE
ncbi:predicted protein [Thalassiosira pseudonana CCMP1335]